VKEFDEDTHSVSVSGKKNKEKKFVKNIMKDALNLML